MTAFWDLPWTMVATIVSMCSLVVGLVTCFVVLNVNIFRPRRRKKSLKAPVDAFFIIPAKRHHTCGYAAQDEDIEGHLIREVTLPSNSETLVDLVLKVQTHFSFTELIIGCDGDSGKP